MGRSLESSTTSVASSRRIPPDSGRLPRTDHSAERARLSVIAALLTALSAAYSAVAHAQAPPTRMEAVPFQPADLAARIRESVATIVGVSEDGKATAFSTAFFVGEGLLITTADPSGKATTFRCLLPSGEEAPALLEAEDLGSSIAMLRTSLRRRALPLSLGLPREGEQVIMVTAAEGLQPTVTEGAVGAIRARPEGGSRIELTIPSSTNVRGSPVANMFGEVIGVATLETREGRTSALPPSSLRALLARRRGSTPSPRLQAAPQSRPQAPIENAESPKRGVAVSAPTDAELGIRAPPPLVGGLRGLTLSGVSQAVLDQIERAVALDRESTVPAEDKATAWEQLASQAPFAAELASRRAQEWRDYGGRRAAASAKYEARETDWRKLTRILAMDIVSDEEKVAAAEAFVQTHGSDSAVNPHASDPKLAVWLARGEWMALQEHLPSEPNPARRVELITAFSRKFPFFTQASQALKNEIDSAERARVAAAKRAAESPPPQRPAQLATPSTPEAAPTPVNFPWLQLSLGAGASAVAAVMQGLAISAEGRRDERLGDSYARDTAAPYDEALASAREEESRREGYQVAAYVSVSVSGLLLAWAAGQLWVF